MPWAILFASAVFEAIWAVALGKSDGLTAPLATTIFLVALVISMLGLGYAAKQIPIGTAYGVWVGIGAALTVTYGMAFDHEPVSFWKIFFIVGIVGAAVGLKALPHDVEDAHPNEVTGSV